MDDKVTYYQYRAPDGRVIANIYVHGEPNMEKVKRAGTVFARQVYEREIKKRLEEQAQ